MNGAQTSDMSSSTGPHLYLVTLPEPVRGKHLRNASMKRDPTAVSKGICNSRHCYIFSCSKTLAWNTQMCYCETINNSKTLFIYFLQIVKVFWWSQPAVPVHHYYYFCLFWVYKSNTMYFLTLQRYISISFPFIYMQQERLVTLPLIQFDSRCRTT